MLLLVWAPSQALAGAWPQMQGQGEIITTLSYYQVRVQGFNAFGKPTGSGTYMQEELSPYVEYGVSPRWTLGLQPRLQEVTQSGLPGTGRTFGLVQFNVFARFEAYRDDANVISVQGQVGVPGAATSSDPELAQPNAEYEARLLYGHGFSLPNGLPGYLDAEAGYRVEENGTADQFRGDATLGLTPLRNWVIMAQSFNTVSVGHAETGETDYDLYRVELSALRTLSSAWAVQFGAWHDAGGRNIALGDAGAVALWVQF